MNCFGALGSSSSCGSPLKFTSFSISCSLVGFFLNFTNTAAVCPFRTGTRMHWQVITGLCAFTITPSFNLSPDTKRLLLALLFLAADVRDDVSYHLRPVLKGLSCSGDCLIGRSYYLIGLKFLPCSQNRCIALDGAVRFYCDKASAWFPDAFSGTRSPQNAPG